MKQIFNENETRLIIFIILLSFIKGAYQIYIYSLSEYEEIYSEDIIFNKLIEANKRHKVYVFLDFIFNLLYFFTAIFFFVKNKIQTIAFGFVCFYMFIASLSFAYKIYLFLGKSTPYSNKALHDLEYISVANNIMVIFVTLYLIKLIFF